MSVQAAPRPGYQAIPAGDDRRARVRHEWNIDALAQVSMVEESGNNCLIELYDISAGGVGLVLSRFFEKGTILEVEVHQLSRGFSAWYIVTVVHSTPRGDGTWFVGCQFSQALSGEEMAAWM